MKGSGLIVDYLYQTILQRREKMRAVSSISPISSSQSIMPQNTPGQPPCSRQTLASFSLLLSGTVLPGQDPGEVTC